MLILVNANFNSIAQSLGLEYTLKKKLLCDTFRGKKTTNKKSRKIFGKIKLHTQAFKNIKYQFLKYGNKGAIETILGHGKVKDR